MFELRHHRHSHRAAIFILSLAAGLGALSGCCTVPPEHKDQKAFGSPEKAVEALLAAVRKGDNAELMSLFGSEGRDILSSGDAVADKRQREVIIVAMGERWALEDGEGDGKATKELVVGNENWPFPIPLVKECWGWRFDSAAGKREVLARRIGRNELAAIGVCQTYVVAQKKYASEGRDGKPAGTFAQKVRSSEGKQDGLYWPTKAGEKRSPLGDLAAQAEAEGYTPAKASEIKPFRGYFYRILTKQGKDAPGGAKDYIVNGQMTGGFALIAFPAEYGNSGIMSFIVNKDGVVLERDLGPDTLKIAGAVAEYNPDKEWGIVD